MKRIKNHPILPLLMAMTLAASALAEGISTATPGGLKVTRGCVYETDDTTKAVQAEFGPGATVADWNEYKPLIEGSANPIATLNAIGVPFGQSIWLTVDGQRVWSGTRHYLAERWDNKMSREFGVHDQIGDQIVMLGSWQGLCLPVLAKVPNTQQSAGSGGVGASEKGGQAIKTTRQSTESVLSTPQPSRQSETSAAMADTAQRTPGDSARLPTTNSGRAPIALSSWNHLAFEAKDIKTALAEAGIGDLTETDQISVKAPDVAEDAAVVPVDVVANLAGIERILLLSESNAFPLIADISVLNGVKPYRLGTRVKLAGSGKVFAVVVADGRTYVADKSIEVILGGLSHGDYLNGGSNEISHLDQKAIPNPVDDKFQVGDPKLRIIPDGNTYKAQVLIDHPMDAGFGRHYRTGAKIPRHHITHVRAKINGSTVLDGQLGGAISKKPYFSFALANVNPEDLFSLEYVDNRGARRKAEARIPNGSGNNADQIPAVTRPKSSTVQSKLADNGAACFGAFGTKDYTTAFSECSKAAETGNADAMSNLGVMYANGFGVSEDKQASFAWYRKAAEQGNPKHQSFFGALYQHGSGVARDEREAVVWYRKAAEQGYPGGLEDLGSMYEAGLGVSSDLVLASMMYMLAEARGSKSAIADVRRVQNKLSAAQLDEARALMASWQVGQPLPQVSKTGQLPSRVLTMNERTAAPTVRQSFAAVVPQPAHVMAQPASTSVAAAIPSDDIAIMVPDDVKVGSGIRTKILINIPDAEKLRVMSDDNGRPYLAEYLFDKGRVDSIEMPIELEKNAHIRAEVGTSRIRYLAERSIPVTLGHICGMSRPDVSIRERHKIRALMQGDGVVIWVPMQHPTEDGCRIDTQTGMTVPANYIKSVVVKQNDKPVLRANWSDGISHRPYLKFTLKGAKSGDVIHVETIDIQGNPQTGQAVAN